MSNESRRGKSLTETIDSEAKRFKKILGWIFDDKTIKESGREVAKKTYEEICHKRPKGKQND